MKQIVDENHKIERKVVSREEAKSFFKDDPYKLELIDAIPEDESVTLYSQGEFTDLCRGVHVPSTSKIKNLNYFQLPVHIGVVTRITKCYSIYGTDSLIKRFESTFRDA